MAAVKTNLTSSSSSSSSSYTVSNQLKTSSFSVRSCRGLHRKLNFQALRLQSEPSLNSDFSGKRVLFKENQGFHNSRIPIKAQSGLNLKLRNAPKWWEKGLQPNMREVTSAQHLVDSLLYAGDKLVILDFFSPGCGGCKALHPKICQMAEMNPEVQFLQVNYEEHKSMCYSLNVHVLPFFRFYGGAQGRLCSFSCTNATIKKFKDALAKHTPERCSLGPTKGLEEKELLALAANKELNFTVPPISPPYEEERVPATLDQIPLKSEEKTLITSGR